MAGPVDPLVDDEEEEEQDVAPPLRYTISSYGIDFDVAGLVSRIEKGSIVNPPFQRGFVWKDSQASSFVESLILGLPVPGIFLSRVPKSELLLVIDGQQRLWSLKYFYEGVLRGKEFVLRGVREELLGKSYRTLPDADRRRLDNAVIHATVVNQDGPPNDQSGVLNVFQRLNTTGTQLEPQEVRTSVYSGPFSDLLSRLNEFDEWRAVFGPPHRREKDEELILRFFALFYNESDYHQPMRTFLDSFLGWNRDCNHLRAEVLAAQFQGVISTLHHSLQDVRLFRPEKAFNVAVFEAVTVGLARRLEKGPVTDLPELHRRYDALLVDGEFKSAYTRATANEVKVHARLKLATAAFHDLP